MARSLEMPTLPLATVRTRLSALIDDVARTHSTLTITRNGTPAAVVLSVGDYESIMETLALLNDPVDQERLAAAERSLAAGDVTSGEDMGRLVAERVRRATGAACAIPGSGSRDAAVAACATASTITDTSSSSSMCGDAPTPTDRSVVTR